MLGEHHDLVHEFPELKDNETDLKRVMRDVAKLRAKRNV